MIFVEVFGLLVTLALIAYKIFGIAKCGALIQAEQQLEESLGIGDGQFLCRPLNIAGLLNELLPSGWMYPAVAAAWKFFVMVFARPQTNSTHCLHRVCHQLYWIAQLRVPVAAQC